MYNCGSKEYYFVDIPLKCLFCIFSGLFLVSKFGNDITYCLGSILCFLKHDILGNIPKDFHNWGKQQNIWPNIFYKGSQINNLMFMC